MLYKVKHKYLLFIITLLLFLPGDTLSQSDSEFTPRVFYSFVNYPIIDDFSMGGLKVFLQVRYSDLTFVKSDDYFTSKCEINMIFRDEDKEIVLDKSFEKSFSVLEYDETVSDSLYFLFEQSFELAPQKYDIEIFNTRRKSLPGNRK